MVPTRRIATATELAGGPAARAVAPSATSDPAGRNVAEFPAALAARLSARSPGRVEMPLVVEFGALTVGRVLFEVRCAGCGVLGWCPCAACIEALVDPEPAMVPGAQSVALLFAHDDVGREFIHALKYRGERAIAGWLGESLALAHLAARGRATPIDTSPAGPTPIDTAPAGLAPIDRGPAGLAPIDRGPAGLAPIDTVTWAPTTAAHRRARGFDQAETLARATAKALRTRPMRLLRRIGGTAQSGASREARLAGPRFEGRARAAQRRILLVDDVVTTGATLRAAAAALMDAGAAAVHVAACARRGRDRFSAVA